MIEWQKRDRSEDRPQVDLDALNPSEREALALLAEGHTAKSIAMLTGRSVAAVNERLREARRKTGIGSSRELARLYAAAHKNRDEKIDLAAVPDMGAAPVLSAGTSWRKGRIVMPLILIGGLAAALIAAQVEQGATSPGNIPQDPQLYNAIPAQRDIGELHEQVRREPRDPAWAGATEKLLRETYSAIPHMNDLTPVRVECGNSLCEVANTLPDEKRIGGAGFNALVEAIQSGPHKIRLQLKQGLQPIVWRFAGAGANGGQLFVEYWSRGEQTTEADPLFGGKLQPEERGTRALYTRVRSEVREASWADPTEAELRAALANVPALQNHQRRTEVHCALSLCEVSVVTTVDEPLSASYSDFMQGLQKAGWNQATDRLGLKDQGSGFIQMLPDFHHFLFYAYFSRGRN